MRAADALREAAEQGLQTYTLPVEGVMKGDQAALELLDEAEPILDYFRGVSARHRRPRRPPADPLARDGRRPTVVNGRAVHCPTV